MKNIFLFLTLVLISNKSFCQNFEYGWHKINNQSESVNTISNIIKGDTLISLFYFSGDSLDADPGLNEDWIISHDTAGSYRIYYITLQSIGGNYIKSYKLIENKVNYSSIDGLAIDNNNQLIITGYSYINTSTYDLDFDPSSNTVGSYSLVSNGSITFVAFYSLDGTFNARIEYPHLNSGRVGFSDLKVNEQNELVLVGYISGTVDMDFTNGTDSLSASGGINDYDALVLKMDLSNQSYLWSKSFGNETDGQDIAFVEAKNGKLFLMGYYEDTPFDLDPSNSGTWTVNNNYGDAVFISSWNGDGTFISGIGIHGEEQYSWVSLLGLAVDNSNNIYVNAYTNQSQTVDLDPTLNSYLVNTSQGNNHFIAKYSLNFALMWAKNIQNSDELWYNNEYYESSLILSNTFLAYSVSSSGETVLFSDQNTNDTLSSGQNFGVIVAALNPINGSIFNQTRIEGNDSNDSYIDLNDYTIDQNENFHLLGEFEKTIDFNQTDFTAVFDTSYNYPSSIYYANSTYNLMLSSQLFLSIDEFKAESTDISIYPNPTSDFITIQSTEIINSINLYDFSGKEVKINSTSTNELDLSNLNAGYYLVKITTNSGILTKKIQKI